MWLGCVSLWPPCFLCGGKPRMYPSYCAMAGGQLAAVALLPNAHVCVFVCMYVCGFMAQCLLVCLCVSGVASWRLHMCVFAAAAAADADADADADAVVCLCVCVCLGVCACVWAPPVAHNSLRMLPCFRRPKAFTSSKAPCWRTRLSHFIKPKPTVLSAR